MNCPACGFENPEGFKFCGHCAEPLSSSLTCAGCGFENPRGFRFCGECARPLDSEDRPSTPDRAPRSYTPKHLAAKILHGKSALEGERKQVTVLFADVKGSMDLAEQVDPEEWHRILNRFFEILTDGVHRFEGTVNQYTGDGIMALFGAPIAHEDHAQRACYAALHLREELRRYADELKRTRGLGFSVRIGLNSGEVVVGKIGDDLRMDYTAQGQTVGLATRMEQLADPGATYVSEHTEHLVRGFFQLRDLGPFELKGLREPLGVYELQGVGPVRTRLEAARVRGFSRLVGRADEMSALETALRRATEGNGQVVGVVGEAGVGKSRLCLEFVEQCRIKGILVHEAHCPAHGKAVPLLPLLELLRNAFLITEQDRDQTAREKIAGRLLLLDRAFEEALPLVFDLLGVPDPERPPPRIDPEARQRQLHAFVRQLVQARSQREPAVLLLDDLHWIDAASDAFLAQIVEAVSGTRTLLLVNYRPEYAAEWTRKSYYQQLPLLPLGPEGVRELLEDLLGSDASLGNLRERIEERTGGNPFFVEEVVQALMESQSLEGERGAYRLLGPVEELVIPETVQVVLAARVDRLPEREKQVLQTAAVIGKKFSEPILGAVADLPERDLVPSLSALQAAEFIHEKALYPVAEYAFRHPLTQEVALGSQLQERRRRIHAAVAGAIEDANPDKLDENAALLAHHWEMAGEARTASHWHARAARRAGVTRPEDAFRHWSRVRELMRSVSPSSDPSPLMLQAIREMLNVGMRVGVADEEVGELSREGIALADDIGDIRDQVFLRTHLAQVVLFSGHPVRCHELASEALATAERSGDPELRWGARETLYTKHYYLGDLEEALRVSDEAVELARSDPGMGLDYQGFTAGGWTLGFRVFIETDLGLLEQADRSGRECEQRLMRSLEPEVLGWMYAGWAWQRTHLGDAASALASGRLAVEAAEKGGSPQSIAITCFYYGIALTRSGHWQDAKTCLERALSVARDRGTWLILEGQILAWLAEASLGAGDGARARLLADKALLASRNRTTRTGECQAYLTLARVQRRMKGLAAGQQIELALDSALQLAEETGARIYLPQVHEERAKLASLRTDDDARDRELREAHRLYVEMGATGHAERIAKELEP